MAIENILVIGGGTMGRGIAQVVATAGFMATVVEPDQAAQKRAGAEIEKSLGRLARAGKLESDSIAAIIDRITFVDSFEGVARDADHVIEAVPEIFELKKEVFEGLSKLCRADVIFASNTSQIPISKLAATSDRPDRFVGTHWFSPPPVMRLIEVIRGYETSDETLETTLELARQYGKETIVCKRDTQGFITSRLMMANALEAARIVEEGIADAEDVNRACVLAFNHAMGPLDTVDAGGLDTLLYASAGVAEAFGDRFRAPQIVHELVNAGHLGTKSGRGFRDYSADK